MTEYIKYPVQRHMYIYNKYHQRQQFEDLPFYFFGSSSSGNSVYFKKSRILIDLGFPSKKYDTFNKYFMYDVNWILLTHEHSDHLNPSTLMRILRVYPHVKFVISQTMFNTITSPIWLNHWKMERAQAEAMQQELQHKYYHRFLFIQKNTQQLDLSDRITIYPHIVSHGNITNVAYELMANGKHILYASDLDHVFPRQINGVKTMELPVAYTATGDITVLQNPFDLIFLEANYDEDVLQRFLEQHPNDAHAKGNLRHISEQETWKYLQYALSEQGTFIPLHASSSFGTLIQDLRKED